MIYSKGNEDIMSRLKEKHKFKSSFLSFGGSLLITLSRPQTNAFPTKLPRQLAQDSMYTASCMLSLTQYLVSS